MGMPLSMLSQVMSTEEFEAHYAAYQMKPWGPYRDNLHAALIAREIANMSGRTVPEGAERTLDDYLFKPATARSEAVADDTNEIDNFVD